MSRSIRHKILDINTLIDIVRRSAGSGRRLALVSSPLPRSAGVLPEASTDLLDLSGLDRVVRTDRRNRAILFEAGVDFAALQHAAGAAGLRAMLPLCPRPGKSALTSYLDREPTIYPRFQWDISDPLLCTEIVLGTGELFRTGGAAGPGSLVQQWRAGDAQKNPMGPGPADFMRIFQGARGAFGAVTWCSAKAEPSAIDERLFVVGSDRLEPLIEMTYAMLRRNHPDICFLVDSAALAALRCRSTESWVAARAKAPGWNLVFSLSKARFAGSQKLAYVRRELDESLSRVGIGGRLDEHADQTELLDVLTNPAAPCNRTWWKRVGHETTRELFLQTTMDRAPALLGVAREVCRAHDWDPADALGYVQPQLGGRCCHLELVFPGTSCERMPELITALTGALARAGGYFSRPHGGDPVVAVEGATALPLMRKLCDVFDPQGVFAATSQPFFRGGAR